MTYKHLTTRELTLIADFWYQGTKAYRAAKLLQRSQETIYRVYRFLNNGKTIDQYLQTYQRHKRRCGRKQTQLPTIEVNYIHAQIKAGWTPDTIIGYILYFLDIEMFDEHDLFFCEGLLSKQLFLERYCCSSSLSTAEEILIDLLNGEYSCENIFDTQISGTFLSHFSPKRFAVVFFSSINEFEEKHATVLRKCKDYFHASHPFVYKNKIILFLHKDHDINQVEDIVKSLQLNVMISDRDSDRYMQKQI